VNGGYGWNADDSNYAPLSPQGGFGGGQIGYNWQGLFGYSPWVIGIEADFQGAGISDSISSGGESLENSLNWFGTVRGRLGYSFGPALLYATGGFAYGQVESKYSAIGFGSDSITETQTGYVVGGGVEYKFNPAWSVKAEYQYINLDASDLNGAGPLNGNYGYSDRSEINTVRVGLNYAVGHGGFGPLN
jgi:outer membrane immunogenic protein